MQAIAFKRLKNFAFLKGCKYMLKGRDAENPYPIPFNLDLSTLPELEEEVWVFEK